MKENKGCVTDGGWPKDVIPEKYLSLDNVSMCSETKKPLLSPCSLGNVPGESASGCLETERPLIIIKPKFLRYWIALLFVIFITLFFIIGVIVPVLVTGDYASIWPASDNRIGLKTKYFYMAWGWIVCFPYFIPIFNRKKICFYNNRVEVHPYLFKNIITINYSNMRVNVHGNYRLTISKISNVTINGPLHFFRNKFIESITFSQRKSNIYDHGLINEAMCIIKEHASEYNFKPLS